MAAGQKYAIQIQIDGDGKAAVTAIDGVSKKLGATQQQATQTTRAMDVLGGSLGKLAASAGALVGFAGLTATLRDITREAAQVQTNFLRTEALLVATGNAAGFSAQQLRDQARDLAYATLQSTEGVERAQQTMLTFKSVTGDTFTRAMELAADTASVFGSLDSATVQLGKALEDPVKGVSALAEVGVSFSESQKEMIKSMVATGDQLGAQTLILDVLAGQMGGVAKAEAAGYAGAQDSMGQAVQEAKLALADQLNTVELATGAYNYLAEGLWAFVAAMGQDVPTGARAASESTTVFANSMRWLGDLFASFPERIAVAQAALSGWSRVGRDAFEGVLAAARWLVAEITAFPNLLGPLYAIIPGIEAQDTAWDQVIENVRFVGQAMMDLPDNLTAAVHIMLGEFDKLKASFTAMKDSLGPIARRAWAAVTGWVQSSMKDAELAVARSIDWIRGRLGALAGEMAGVMESVPSWMPGSGYTSGKADDLRAKEAALSAESAWTQQLRGEIERLNAARAAASAATQAEIDAIDAKAKAERAAAQERIDAALADREAKMQAREADKALSAEFERAIRDQERLERQTRDTTSAITSAVPPAAELGGALGGAGGSGGSGGRASVAGGARAAASALDDYADRVAAVLGLTARQKATLIEILPTIDAMAQKYGVAREVIISMIEQESQFNRFAESGKKAMGLMQIMPGTAKEIAREIGLAAGVIERDWNANIEAGTYYFAKQLAQFKDLEKALRAYNAGPGAVEKSKQYKETNDYVLRITGSIEKLIPLAGQGGQALNAMFTDPQQAARDLQAEIESLGARYDTAASQQRAYEQSLREIELLHAAGEMSAKEYAAAIAKAGREYRATRGPMASYFASLEEGLQSIESVAVDVFDKIRTALIDGLAQGKLAFGDFVTYAKRALAEIAVNRVMISVGGALGLGSGTAQAASGSNSIMGMLSNIAGSLTSNSIGNGVAQALGSLGSFFGASPTGPFLPGQAINSMWSTGLGNLAGMSNWMLGGAGIAGSILGSALFGGQGQSNIGASIGSAAGTVIGSMILPGIGTAIGAALGGAGGGFLGSLFGGGKEDASTITLNVAGGWMGVTGATGALGNNAGPVYEAVAEVNAYLDDIGNLLGDAAQAARRSYTHPGQALDESNLEKWIGDLTKDIVSRMVQATKDDALASAGGQLLGDMMGYMLDQAGDDPQIIVAAIEAAKGLNTLLTKSVKAAFDFENDPVFTGADQAAQTIWNLAQSMGQSGEAIDQTLSRLLTNINLATQAFDLIGQPLTDIALSPEELVRSIELTREVEVEVERALADAGAQLNDTIAQSLVDAFDPTLSGPGAMAFDRDWASSIFGPMAFNIEMRMQAVQDAAAEAEQALAETATTTETQIETYYETVALTEAEIAEALARKRAEIGEKLAEYAGGADVLQAGMATYYDKFFSQAEKDARAYETAQRQIREALGTASMSLDDLPETREGLRDLIESQDLTTDAGQRTFGALMSVAGALDTMYGYLEQLADAGLDAGDAFADLRIGLLSLADSIAAAPIAQTDIDAARDALTAAGYSGGMDAEGVAAFLRALAIAEDAGGEASEAIIAMGDTLGRVIDHLAAEAAELERIAEERTGLEIRLARALGDESGAVALERERELASIDESNRALMEHIWALEDEAAALAELERIADERMDLEIRLMRAIGDESGALALEREREIASIDESNRALLRRIWLIEDAHAAADAAYAALEQAVAAEREAIETRAQAEREAIEAATAAEREAIDEAHQARMEALDAERVAAQTALSTAQSALSAIQSAVSTLRGELDAIDEFSYRRAQRMLAGYAAGGTLSDADLSAALAAITSDVSGQFASQSDYEIARARDLALLESAEARAQDEVDVAQAQLDAIIALGESLDEARAAQIEALESATQAQIEALDARTEAEMAALDDLLATARDELDTLRGIETGVLAVAEASEAFAASLESLRGAMAGGTPPTVEIVPSIEHGELMRSQVEETAEVRAEVAMMRDDVVTVLREIRDAAGQSTRVLRQWDGDGLPAAREDTTLIVEAEAA